MIDCEVCLQPTFDPVTVTFALDDVDPCTTLFCRDCITVTFRAMTSRYNEAVVENNRVVAEVIRVFGIPAEPFRCGHGRTGTETCPFCDTGIETAMCTTWGHEEVPAVGDALSEEPDEARYPYCSSCRDALGTSYDVRRWEQPAQSETTS